LKCPAPAAAGPALSARPIAGGRSAASAAEAPIWAPGPARPTAYPPRRRPTRPSRRPTKHPGAARRI